MCRAHARRRGVSSLSGASRTGGVLVLGAAGGREAGGESGHCLVCGSGEEIRRVERSGRGWSAFISSADSRVDVRKARFSERCTRAP